MKHIKHLLFITIVLSLAILACRISSSSEVVSGDDTAEEFILLEEPMGEVDIEIQYAQKVWDALFGCFKSYVYDTENPNEFIAATNGTQIRLIEQDKLRKSDKLNEADKANGILWEGFIGINIIYKEPSGEWQEPRPMLYWGLYRYYEDGTIKRKAIETLSKDWREIGATCPPSRILSQ
jgi:hypothetical protein